MSSTVFWALLSTFFPFYKPINVIEGQEKWNYSGRNIPYFFICSYFNHACVEKSSFFSH